MWRSVSHLLIFLFSDITPLRMYCVRNAQGARRRARNALARGARASHATRGGVVFAERVKS